MPRRHGLSDAGVTAGTNLVLDSVAKESLSSLAAELQCTRSEVVRRLLTADPDALRALLAPEFPSDIQKSDGNIQESDGNSPACTACVEARTGRWLVEHRGVEQRRGVTRDPPVVCGCGAALVTRAVVWVE